MLAFFELLYSKSQKGEGADRLSRSLTRSGHLMYSLYGSFTVSFPWKSIWHVKVPKSVLFFF